MSRERYVVKSFGGNIEGTRAGVVRMFELLQSHRSAAIIVPVIGKVKDSLLTDVLGPEFSKTLIKDRVLTFEDGKKVFLGAQSTLSNYRGCDIILDLWGSADSIGKIEEQHGWKAVILVTWVPEDSAAWEKSHNVAVIYNDKRTSL